MLVIIPIFSHKLRILHWIRPVLNDHSGFHFHTSRYPVFSLDDSTKTNMDALLNHAAVINDSTTVDDTTTLYYYTCVDDSFR